MHSIVDTLKPLRLVVMALLIVLASIVGLAVQDPPDASAYVGWIDIECSDHKVTEGGRFRLHIITGEPSNLRGETIKVYWTTVAGTADETDYHALHREGQASNRYQSNEARMGRHFYTKQDTYSEDTEHFTVYAVNASSHGSGSGSCRIAIEDDDGPGAAETWIESLPIAGKYQRGGRIRIKQRFTEEVIVEGGEVNLGLLLGQGSNVEHKGASYISGSGTDTLTFEYTVTGDDLDIDGIEVPNSDYGGDGSILTEADRTEVNSEYRGIPTDVNHFVYGRTEVLEVSVISSPAGGDTYRMGEHLEIAVRFHRAVQVNGRVHIVLRIGDDEEAWAGAWYDRGSGTDTLVFRHAVRADDVDTGGFRVVNGSIGPEGQRYGFGGSGTITDHGADHEVSPYYNGLIDPSGYKVDGRPYIKSIAVTSTPANGTHYRINDRIMISATFDRAVSVQPKPAFKVNLGDQEVLARFYDGSLTDTLVFSYKVEEDDTDANGISIPAQNGFLESGNIWEARTDRRVNERIPALADQAGQAVKGSLPSVVSSAIVSTPSHPRQYHFGEDIEIALTFDEPVDVLGTPSIRIEMDRSGPHRRDATYRRGSGTDTLVFVYTVQGGDLDHTGVALVERESEGFDGTARVYQKGTENQANGRIPGFSDMSDHRVDGLPHITAKAVESTPARRGIYRAGESLLVSLTYDRPMEVVGRPPIYLRVGDDTPGARYRSGSGTNTIVFGYDVQADDRDYDGFSLLDFRGGFPLNDYMKPVGVDIPFARQFKGFGSQEGHAVAGRVHITSVDVISEPGEDGVYEMGDTIEMAVTFDDDVTVAGTPQLTLDLDGATQVAAFHEARNAASGSSTGRTGDVLVLTYTVQTADEATDGLKVGQDAFSLNGGTITDPNGNEPDLRHAASTFADHPVVEVAPVVDSVRTSQDGSQVIITFSENVQVRPDLQTLSSFAGVDVGVYLRALIDVFVDDHRAHTHGAAISGKELTLTMDTAITQGQDVEVAYDDVFARDVPGVIVDHAGNPLEHFSSQMVANESTLPADADANWPVISAYSLAVAEGQTGTYTVALGAQPDEDVTVSLTISPATHLTADAETLTFTPANWSTPQTVTLTASTDADDVNFWQEIVHTADTDGFIVGHLKVLIEE